jgi:hypothetical protein
MSYVRLSAAVEVGALALVLSVLGGDRVASATGAGPTINLVNPAVVSSHADFSVSIDTAGAVPDAYAGYQLVVVYDSSILAPTTFQDETAPSGKLGDVSCAPPLLADNLGGSLTPPLVAAELGCAGDATTLPVSTTATGEVARLTFHPTRTGKAALYLASTQQTPTETLDAAFNAQMNALTCNETMCIPFNPLFRTYSMVEVAGDSIGGIASVPNIAAAAAGHGGSSGGMDPRSAAVAFGVMLVVLMGSLAIRRQRRLR